jgi:hypothetical protein
MRRNNFTLYSLLAQSEGYCPEGLNSSQGQLVLELPSYRKGNELIRLHCSPHHSIIPVQHLLLSGENEKNYTDLME